MPLSLHSVMLIKVEIYKLCLFLLAGIGQKVNLEKFTKSQIDAEISIPLADLYVYVYLVEWTTEKNEEK